MGDLFAADTETIEGLSPLAERLRPKSLDEVVGQEHLTGPDGTISRMISSGSLGSMIFWGPPGTGKTTVARLLAGTGDLKFVQVSAIFSGVADLKKVFGAAKVHRSTGKKTLLFVDEIHRFNKAQLDSFLPVMEDGTIVLVGATTENPSFELNAALLSRSTVLTFKSHDEQSLAKLLERAEELENSTLPLDEGARASLIRMADGDGRAIISLAEEIWRVAKESEVLSAEALQEVLQRRAPIYDKGQDGHYNLISALHKSVRGSDPDAALYYLARMMEAGEDRRFIGRRLVVMASEDIGNADPQALPVTMAAVQAFDFLGPEEGDRALAQACVYLASAPKSNAVHVAIKKAKQSARENGSLLPPRHILNAPTKLMKEQGYGDGYRYDHDQPDGFSGQNYFPEQMDRETYYEPVERGFERDIIKRLEYWDRLRKERS
ncbi:MAG: replication-associated recombination protein A [Rhizobiaceae bacterium]|nr:replication-associated recombination protein A [Rhizobiaceae bacterium]